MDEMKQLICFDLDSTLINSDMAHVYAYNKALKDLNLPRKKPKEIYRHFGKPKEWVVDAITPKNTPLKIKQQVTKLHDRYLVKKFYKKVKKMPGVVEIIKKLKKNYKLAVLSNCNHNNIKYLLKGAGINPKFFNILIGNDDVEHPKPCPDEIFKAEKIAKEEASYMIGDSIYDVKAGRMAKVKTIAIVTGHNSINQLKKEKPYKIIKSIKELPNVIN